MDNDAIAILKRMEQLAAGYDIQLTDLVGVGYGQTDYRVGYQRSMVGTGGMLKKRKSETFVNDRLFLSAVVAFYHEVRHCNVASCRDADVELGLSVVSTFDNGTYYAKSRNELPHEIDAEYHGIVAAWDFIREYKPAKADKAMIDFVNWRASESRYVIQMPKGGFKSRAEVEKAFGDAYDRSLNEVRRVRHPDILDYPDAVSMRMVTRDGYVRRGFGDILAKLVSDVPGREMDRMMASLSCFVDPRNRDYMPCLEGVDLDVRTVFGIDPDHPKPLRREVPSVRSDRDDGIGYEP